MLDGLASLHVKVDGEFVVLALRVGDLADGIDELPWAGIDRVLGARDSEAASSASKLTTNCL